MRACARDAPAPHSGPEGAPQTPNLRTKTSTTMRAVSSRSRRVSGPKQSLGRGGEKRTCSRPRRTIYLPLCAGLPALTLQAATVARSRHTCGVVSCRFQGGPPTLAHDRSPERLDESRAPHLTSASTVAKFLCKTKKPQSEVVATQVKRKGGGKSHRLAATGPGRVACETTLGHGGMSPTIGGSRGASAGARWLKRMHAVPT